MQVAWHYYAEGASAELVQVQAQYETTGGGKPLLGRTSQVAPCADGECRSQALAMVNGHGALCGELQKALVVERIARCVPCVASANSRREIDAALLYHYVAA